MEFASTEMHGSSTVLSLLATVLSCLLIPTLVITLFWPGLCTVRSDARVAKSKVVFSGHNEREFKAFKEENNSSGKKLKGYFYQTTSRDNSFHSDDQADIA